MKTPESSTLLKQEIKADIKFHLNKIPEIYRKELMDFFDLVATMSHEKHPKSTSPRSEKHTRTLGSGKVIAEKGQTIQDTLYPELFTHFSKLSFFEYLYANYFSSLGKSIDQIKEIFIDCLKNDIETLSQKISSDEAYEFINILIEIQKEIGLELSPELLNLPKEENIRNSDLISNMLFLRTSGVLNQI